MSSCSLALASFDSLVEFRVALGIEPVGGLEQVQAQVLRVIRLRLRRGKPIPQLPLPRLEVIPQLNVIRQRLKNVLGLFHRVFRAIELSAIKPKTTS